jgi:MerR family transcriptional regulator/heat shock protein HspR
MGLNQLDDEDYPAVTMGQAAELLDVQPAFLRSLEVGNFVSPARTAGGHRRYSRRQLQLAARIRAFSDQGLTLDAAQRITRLEDEITAAHGRITELEDQLGDAHARHTEPDNHHQH